MKTNRPDSRLFVRLLAGLLCGLGLAAHAASPGSGITYQGRLAEGGKPASGAFDLRFALRLPLPSVWFVGFVTVAGCVNSLKQTPTFVLPVNVAACPSFGRTSAG